MVDRKLSYKTKICMSYQRGRCTRHNCSFAHGEADLRRSFDGRQDRGSKDLRERLDRMRSPSGRRDASRRHQSRGDSPPSSRKRIKNWENKHLDSQSDYSGAWRTSDGTTEGQIKDRRNASSNNKIRTDEQLREILSEIKNLDGDKRELEIYMGNMVHETDALTLKVQELEMQLSKEREECKRITTKVKKFIKAHNRHLHLQDELKRSHAQLWKLGDSLDSDADGCNENDDNNIITSEAEACPGAVNPTYETKLNSSPGKKKPRVLLETHESSIRDNPVNGENNETGKIKPSNFYRSLRSFNQSDNHEPSVVHAPIDDHPVKEKSRDRSKPRHDIASASKSKVSETNVILPSTGIAAHEMDEEDEFVEVDEKVHASRTKEDVSLNPRDLPFLPPPPPPIPKNAYSQYKGDDEHVDIDGINEDMVEVDIVL